MASKKSYFKIILISVLAGFNFYIGEKLFMNFFSRNELFHLDQQLIYIFISLFVAILFIIILLFKSMIEFKR